MALSEKLEIEEVLIVQQVLEVCRRLHERNMLAASDGNVSYRFDDERILITPSGRHKAFLGAQEMAAMDLSGRVLGGNPSSEKPMHLELYRQCPQARCIIHAHPPHAVAWSIARPELKELPADCMSEVILSVGGIPIVPYARPSTEAMGKALLPFLPDHKVMILSRHGALSWGTDVEETYNGMERLEHAAQILMLAQNLGGLHPLDSEEVSALRAMREQKDGRSL